MLVVFEGADGVGKSTFIKQLEDCIREKEKQVVSVCLPSFDGIGKHIRDALFSREYGTKFMAKGVSSSLYMADFINLQDRMIIPSLNSGKIVLCDRWYYSDYAYSWTMEDKYGIYDDIWKAYQKCEVVKPNKIVFCKANKEDIGIRLNGRARRDLKQEGKIWGSSEVQEKVQQRYEDLFDLLKLPNVVHLDISGTYTKDLVYSVYQSLVG